MPAFDKDHQEIIDTKKEFSLFHRGRSFANAGRGLSVFLKTTPNAWIEAAVMAAVVIAGSYFHISRHDWLAVVFASALVLVAEAFNTAIEIDINLTSPGYHPYARDTKDVAAGAVLMAAIAAAVIGIFVFYPYIFS